MNDIDPLLQMIARLNHRSYTYLILLIKDQSPQSSQGYSPVPIQVAILSIAYDQSE